MAMRIAHAPNPIVHENTAKMLPIVDEYGQPKPKAAGAIVSIAVKLNENKTVRNVFRSFRVVCIFFMAANTQGKRRRKERSEWRVPTRPVKMAKPWALLASA